jgi:hypothetical protein
MFFNSYIAAVMSDSCDTDDDANDDIDVNAHRNDFMFVCNTLLPAMNVVYDEMCKAYYGTSGIPIQRTRNTVRAIMTVMGPQYARRYYRMETASFWKLCALLSPEIEKSCPGCTLTGKRKRGSTSNGEIHPSIRLSCALRYFAGSDPLETATLHGISHTTFFESVWIVVNSINATKELNIRFPSDEESQRSMALEFFKKSKAKFASVVAAIDGILIWTTKPSEADCAQSSCGALKYLCGRKKKYGLNMQAACDARYRFVDVSIGHPGATSDYLAFMTSAFQQRLQGGLLAKGMVILGDAAYVSTSYMATPFKSCTERQDAYNFYHSQLRITIECAFGMLVHRWGLLRKAMPKGIRLNKVTAMVMTMCKLHNFCIDENSSPDTPPPSIVPETLEEDAATIGLQGAIEVEQVQCRVSNLVYDRPSALLEGGNHCDDFNRERAIQLQRIREGLNLPQQVMFEQVEKLQLERPLARKRQGK